MHTEFLIIGQGISGTWLAYWLDRAGRDYHIIDDKAASASSRVAAGVINPVTGRRYVSTWMAETLLPFARESYTGMEGELSVPLIAEKTILDFFPTPQMRNSFFERLPENEFLRRCEDENHFRPLLNYDFGCGAIRPAFVVDLQTLLGRWRSRDLKTGRLSEDRFEATDLDLSGKSLSYRDIRCEKIIFCDGQHSFALPWFKNLPFAPNKGEALLVELEGLPDQYLYKKGMVMVPLSPAGLFWVGASYEWDYDHTAPTETFRKQAEAFLRQFVGLPYRVVDHRAAIRPATLERRPFAGLHPAEPRIGILNGMGTKGCSLAPYFARQLSEHLINKEPIHPNADIKRFTRILSG